MRISKPEPGHGEIRKKEKEAKIKRKDEMSRKETLVGEKVSRAAFCCGVCFNCLGMKSA